MLYDGTSVKNANLAATVTINQAITTKEYQSQPNFKLFYSPKKTGITCSKREIAGSDGYN